MRLETFATGLTLSILLFAIGTYPPQESTRPETAAPDSPSPLPQRIRVGEKVESTSIVRIVQPEYPAAARDAHVTGEVVLHCTVGKDGAVHALETSPALASC